MITERSYTVEELEQYIDWSYFLHAWQMPTRYSQAWSIHNCTACRSNWIAQQSETDKDSVHEALRLVDDSRNMLITLNTDAEIKGKVGLFEGNSVEDDIIVKDLQQQDVCIPCLRQQKVHEGKSNLCLADYLRPKSSGEADTLGVFATTVLYDPDSHFPDDPYNHMMAQTLCDRLSEAAACRLHEEVRKEIWGFAHDEQLTINDLLHEHNQGIRPAVGYPSLPDQSINFIINELIGMEQMGIMITQNGAMKPHATVSGLIFANKNAHYFNVGAIDHTQLTDYSVRRCISPNIMEKFLAANYMSREQELHITQTES